MKRSQQESNGAGTTCEGNGGLSVTLDQLVDYAKDLDDQREAEKMELMCYRMFGRRLTPEAADKIAEIPEQFKKKRQPTIGKLITINNNGDKVERKTVIPSVGSYNENVEEQRNEFPAQPFGGQEQLKLAE